MLSDCFKSRLRKLLSMSIDSLRLSHFSFCISTVPSFNTSHVQPCSQAPLLWNEKLNLYMRREPGIFSHVRTLKGRKAVERP